MSKSKLEELDQKFQKELKQNILPYWIEKTPDYTHGGFIGRVDSYDVIHPKADKGVILNTRLLWTFAASYRKYSEQSYLEIADRAYQYILNNFLDHENGGCYWMLDYQGNPINDYKYLYAQSFMLYALSEYYSAVNEESVLKQCVKLFEIIEEKCCTNEGHGYNEVFDCDWNLLTGVVLGDDKEASRFTMNTHLHLMEAYTNLYKVWQNSRLKDKLTRLIQLHLNKMYDSEAKHFYSFFKEDWQPQIPEYSYGHDIEAAWLLYDSSIAINDSYLIEVTSNLIQTISKVVLKEGYDHKNGGVFNSGVDGSVVDTDKQWWVQAETIVGLSYAWMLTETSDYLLDIEDIWDYIDQNFKDHKKGEWYFLLSENGTPYTDKDKVGPWKGPYHTVRMCLEVNKIAQYARVDS